MFTDTIESSYVTLKSNNISPYKAIMCEIYYLVRHATAEKKPVGLSLIGYSKKENQPALLYTPAFETSIMCDSDQYEKRWDLIFDWLKNNYEVDAWNEPVFIGDDKRSTIKGYTTKLINFK